MVSENRHLFSSESVTEGHPDKIADQVSDAVLDAILDRDPDGRVACETLVSTGLVFMAGEITTDAHVDFTEVARRTIEDIGYEDGGYGLDHETCSVLTAIGKQSPDIAMGVDSGGAGDQGMMFGYATRETESLMPMPISLAHRLTKRLSDARRQGDVEWLRPDGKSQVTVEYRGGRPQRVTTVVVSAQHAPGMDQEEVRQTLIDDVVTPVLPDELYDPDEVTFHINPTGRFEIGGPQGDAGVTGRKVIVDTYGGVGSHGGGAFSGPEPVSVMVDTGGTGAVPDEDLMEVVERVFDLRPEAIIEDLGLLRPIYRRTAAFGHFGREPDEDGGFSWERTDRVDALKAAV